MPTSAFRERLSTALLDFAWDEWTQMGVLGAARRHSRWAQDPEALVLFTLEVARDDPRLFDEVLDWLVRNAPTVSARRLRTLCDGPDDARLAGAALGWVAGRRRPNFPTPQTAGMEAVEPQPLFRGLSVAVGEPDPVFLASGFIRPAAEPSGKSRDPDLAAAINFAFRLRRLLGVSARAEAVRYLLTADVSRATVAAVASSAGYAKRNVQEALASLHASGVVSLVTVGSDQRFGIDDARWSQLLGLDVRDLPIHRDWPQLLAVLRKVLRWLRRPELGDFSAYLRSSQARDLLEAIGPPLAHAGVITAARSGGDESWNDLVDTIDDALLALDPRAAAAGWPSSFEIYADASGRHRWRLKAANGRIVAMSAEAYVAPASAKAAVERIRANAEARPYRIEPDQSGNFRWRVVAANGQTVAASGESFASRHDAERDARDAIDLASSAARPY